MKKIIAGVMAAGMMLAFCGGASAEEVKLYHRQLDNPSTFETLQEAHESAPVFSAEEAPERIFAGDPALDEYPENTTWVYRSPGMFNGITAAPHVHTNVLVYTDEHFEDKAEALDYITGLGLTDMVDEVIGSVVLVTPIDPEKGFGDADQYAYYQLQSAMCNVGYALRGAESTTYYADGNYFGGINNRYLIGVEGGATFINNYIAPNMDYIGRIAGMLLVGGEMERIRQIPNCVPVWLVNGSETAIQRYAEGNETDSTGRNGDDEIYYNSKHPIQQVIVTNTDEVDLPGCVNKAFYDLFLKCMRVPAVTGGLYSASTEYRHYNGNQVPYSLGKRNALINGVTSDGLHYFECHDVDLMKDCATEQGEYVTTWYELLPEEVLDGTAEEHSIPLLLMNHGGGADPIQGAEELGWVRLAGEERFAIIGERHTSENLNGRLGDPSPWNTLSDSMPILVRHILEKYPQLDPSRVYVTGYSMGGGATNRCVYGDASLFAAAVNMSGTPIEHTEEQEEQFKELDIPMMLTTCRYDTWTHFDNENGYIAEDFQQNINSYLGYNEMETVEFDFEKYPLSGFKGDIYRETTLNDEYQYYSWFFLNEEGVPMVGLGIIEDLQHALWQEYADLAWDYMSRFSRDPETKEIVYDRY